MTGQQLYDALVTEITEMHSSFSVKFKDESLYMRFLAVLVYPFNAQFLTDFTTTMGSTVYFPSKAALAKRWGSYARILAHEWVHIWDGEQRPLRFTVGYATDSKRARLAVFFTLLGAAAVSFVVRAIWLSGWWAFLAGAALTSIAPWRAYWRAEAEYRGYAMGIAISYWKYLDVPDRVLEARVPTFTGMAYYRMDPSEKRVLARLEDIRESCWTGGIRQGPRAVPYVRVHEVLRGGGLLKEATGG